MSIEKALQLKIDGFVPSDFWIHQFKKKHKVVSRKITKLVTTRDVDSQTSIYQSAGSFADNARKIANNYDHNLIINTDQSGLQLEMFGDQMLSYQGEQLTLGSIRSISNSTHSHTVQPIISISGRWIGPLFLP